jgi:uncharacterized integral membrane protein
MTLPAENRPRHASADDLPPRAPEPGWTVHGSADPAPLQEDEPAFRDPAPIPTTEVEPIPTPGSTTHRPGATDPDAAWPGTTEPGTTDPGITGPGITGPGTTDPGITGPGATRPGEGLRAARPRMFTRISAAWLGVWAGLLVVILLIIFIAQNTADVRIRFLWLDGLIPTALALLIAGVGGAIIAMAVAAARIVQLRRLVRRRRD